MLVFICCAMLCVFLLLLLVGYSVVYKIEDSLYKTASEMLSKNYYEIYSVLLDEIPQVNNINYDHLNVINVKYYSPSFNEWISASKYKSAGTLLYIGNNRFELPDILVTHLIKKLKLRYNVVRDEMLEKYEKERQKELDEFTQKLLRKLKENKKYTKRNVK